ARARDRSRRRSRHPHRWRGCYDPAIPSRWAHRRDAPCYFPGPSGLRGAPSRRHRCTGPRVSVHRARSHAGHHARRPYKGQVATATWRAAASPLGLTADNSTEENKVTEFPYRTALIVGAGSGISASVARRLAALDVKVGLAARNVEKLQALRGE